MAQNRKVLVKETMALSAHQHDHHAGRENAPARFDRAFAVGIGLNATIVIMQVVFGFRANSLALLADAAHNFSDVVALVLAWGAMHLGRRKPAGRHTYGYRKASILAALANTALLLVVTGSLGAESVQRLLNPQPSRSQTVLWVAAVSIVINLATALLFRRGAHNDLNIKSAFLHMTSDAVLSFGVLVAALLTLATGWLWTDPLMSLIISAAILWSAWGLARDSLHLAMDAVPVRIDLDAVRGYLEGLPGVTGVHDLHVWALSTTENALTAHLIRPGNGLDDRLLHDIAHELQKCFRIAHTTLQVEKGDLSCPCGAPPTHVI